MENRCGRCGNCRRFLSFLFCLEISLPAIYILQAGYNEADENEYQEYVPIPISVFIAALSSFSPVVKIGVKTISVAAREVPP
mgnify:CR=1 FL=1